MDSNYPFGMFKLFFISNVQNVVHRTRFWNNLLQVHLKSIMVITKLPYIEQSSIGKGTTHKSTNKQNQSTTGKLGKPQWPWFGTGISKEMVGWIRFNGAKPPVSIGMPDNINVFGSKLAKELKHDRQTQLRNYLCKHDIYYHKRKCELKTRLKKTKKTNAKPKANVHYSVFLMFRLFCDMPSAYGYTYTY